MAAKAPAGSLPALDEEVKDAKTVEYVDFTECVATLLTATCLLATQIAVDRVFFVLATAVQGSHAVPCAEPRSSRGPRVNTRSFTSNCAQKVMKTASQPTSPAVS